jgi:hypothetical protein
MKPRKHRDQPAKAYLTTRLFLSSSSRAIRAAAAEAIAIEGFAVKAKGGWVIKEYANGHIERLSQLEAVKRPSKIVLD